MTFNFDEIESVSFSRKGWAGRVKSPIIWAVDGGGYWPICYLTKPRYVSDENFNKFLDGFTFEIKKVAK